MRLYKFLFLTVCLWHALFLNACAEDITFSTAPLTIITQQENLHFTVEVATTPQQEELGLMFRKNLAELHGMLFDFGKPRHVDMWMKNTLIPLDMLFIDDKGIVTQIVANAKPESTDIIASTEDAAEVLELAGGAAARYHIAKGDKVLYSLAP